MRLRSTRIGGVLGQRLERTLGGAIGADEGLAGLCRHRSDIDDRAFDLLPAHDLDGLLHQEERRTHIDRKHPVEQFRARIEDRAAVGDRGSIHQRIDPPELRVAGSNHLDGILDAFEIRLDIDHFGPCLRLDFARLGLTLAGIAPANHNAGGPPRRQKARQL